MQKRAVPEKERNPNKLPGQFYFNFTGFPFPIGPFFTRRTVRYEVSGSLLHNHQSRHHQDMTDSDMQGRHFQYGQVTVLHSR